MTDQEREALLSLCLMAAFADGGQGDQERAEVRRIAARLAPGDGAIALLTEEVLLGKRTVEASAAALASPELKKLGFELAACICAADAATSDAERAFLERLRVALGLEAAPAQAAVRSADALAAAPLPPPLPPAGAARHAPDAAALDKAILDAAILNGALELLPESISTLAIIPLQMRLVYRIGQAHGYELDRGHVKDFLATAGVGLTSQYVEQVGRKLLGGVLGALGGRMLGGLGRQAVSSATAFATTYALGQVAKRYYGSGRTLTMDAVKATFQEMLGDAQALGQRYGADIEQRAKTIDPARLLASLREP